jgi:hypothetical protein
MPGRNRTSDQSVNCVGVLALCHTAPPQYDSVVVCRLILPPDLGIFKNAMMGRPNCGHGCREAHEAGVWGVAGERKPILQTALQYHSAGRWPSSSLRLRPLPVRRRLNSVAVPGDLERRLGRTDIGSGVPLKEGLRLHRGKRIRSGGNIVLPRSLAQVGSNRRILTRVAFWSRSAWPVRMADVPERPPWDP